ncbi:MAG: long-chain fatty acid--CoA ligase [Prevotella sp.]|uniref:AMP-dependent synthetase/ligase n=1 Tax=Prevotella sp. TaxID=59823 RepID=UPI002A2B8D5F|nr:long-chain fatty acid--CoA ligase [Prevotella sp.]MDD7317218.1 long-chain fatty acid--CoA ligase [Prevotellaceae bacterium]MDY4019822.1 long-chain fatty acid--CoA ligase [Prevotella sp.]
MQTKCHLSALVHKQAAKYGDRQALIYRDFGSLKWKSLSWNSFSQRVKQVSNAMLNLGVGVQENVGIFAQNCVHYLYTDFGAFGIRAVTVPFYATSSEQQLQYIVSDAQIRVLFVGEQEQYEKAQRVLPLCPSLEKIIIFDRSVRLKQHDVSSIFFDDFMKLGENYPRQSEVESLYGQANKEDLANILYTSGTTGDSKGVMLSHGQYEAAMEANGGAVPVGEKDRLMMFLPITHIFERAWDFYAISQGSTIIVNTYPKEVQQSMAETHPTCMCSVPRFWEKVYIGVRDKIESSGMLKRKLFNKALSVGRKYNIEYVSRGKRPPLSLALEYKMFDKTVFSIVRKQLGLENAHFFPTAGSYVNAEVEEFVHSIGLNMMVGYGLTESLATVSNDRLGMPFTVGSVGRPLKEVEIKFGENEEILLKGPTITKGYYNRDALNRESFTDDGFFRTGDAGYMKDGELFLKERIKELYKTSNGKYIAPQMIESKLLVDKFIDQIAVIADKRKYVSALIVPDFTLLEEYAREHDITFNRREDLCRNPKIIKMLRERIDTLQQQLAGYEQIKNFTLIPHNFTIEAGELTNTLKIKRRVLNVNYAAEIENMYEE